MVKRKRSIGPADSYIKRSRRAAKAKRSATPTALGQPNAGSIAEAAKSNESNRLLSLPAEIRNTIYEIATGDLQTEYETYKCSEIAPLLEQHTQDTDRMARLNLYPPLQNEAEYAHFRCLKRDWLALGQTCRRLHGEFRSLQNSLTHVYISVRFLKGYLETFHPVPDKTISNPRIPTRPVSHPAKITVFFNKFDKKEQRPFDVLPLMRLMKASPSLGCDVWTLNPSPQPHGVEDRDIHDALFATQNSLWAHPDPKFLPSLNRISFTPQGILSISVQDEVLKDWMKTSKMRQWTGADWKRKRGKGIDKGGTWVKDRQEHTRKYLEASGMNVELLKGWKVTVGEGAG
ncbi:hypothetical protein J4E93_005844 [Alternaria ventricosa]|uniref:uncharacterized protein n=1 Tax=Alternaria ventricosa TaxID=1187951 RepID=UPI0020C2B1F5|nr:uncharacterized protein J4E93_005844 [Alternaria ventricosa]KAI4645045.1 hypothetical protein J4E93_005844 [Alternaria ventricosa]